MTQRRRWSGGQCRRSVPTILSGGAELSEQSRKLIFYDKLRLLASRVESLEKAVAARVRNLKIRIEPGVPIDELRVLLSADGRGKGRVVLATRTGGHDVDVALPGTYAIQPKTLSGLNDIPGITEIREF